MNRRNVMVASLVALIALVGVVYYAVFREPEAPNAPIEAVPIEPETTEEVVAEAPEPTEKAEPTEETELTEESTEESTTTSSSESVAFEINPEQSSARFELDEDLRGNRITVVGTAEEVAAQILFDPADLSSAQIGTVLVNARTFATDNNFRNRAIHNRILFTADYEFITFEPTELVGLPASADVGDTIEFQIVGDLTIVEVTREATFDAVVTAVDDETLEGSASSVILLTDYELEIPQVPNVANIEEELELYLDFVAVAVDDG